jgi:hypothetical protein
MLIFSTSVKAEDVISLNKGDKAPFTGILMDNAKANNIRLQLVEADFNKALNTSYERSIQLYKQNEKMQEDKTTALLKQNEILLQRIRSDESMSTLKSIGWMTLGILVTVAGGLIVQKAAH